MKMSFAVCVQTDRIETDPARHPDTGRFPFFETGEFTGGGVEWLEG
jgi:hypothetical protein